MTKNLKLLLYFVLALFSYNLSFAQQKDSVNVGYTLGTVMDSVHNYILKSATVSIYKADNMQIVNYQLTDGFGKFQFKNLPLATKLRIVVTYIGYSPYKSDFTIPNDEKKIDLKTLNVSVAENYLNEVKITTRPPMQLRGDTLEFYADAFKLDTNAVVEDFLKKLKGVTIWNDGLITVNGQKVNSVLVEGKPFFGGDTKVAIQNLPKNAVDKIQVYQDKRNKEIIDPPVDLNIVLKKDKKYGYFGKIGVGYGTDSRYSTDGMISMFNPKTQLTLIGSKNNVNKTPANVNELLQYSSFKGEGVGNSYSSDFSKKGSNVNTAAGFALTHDFNKESKLSDNYFFSDSKNTIEQRLKTITTLGDGVLEQTSRQNANNSSLSHKNDGNYSYQTNSKSFSFGYAVENSNNINSNIQTTKALNTSTGISSQNFETEDAQSNYKQVDFSANYNSSKYYDQQEKKIRSINLDIKYSYHHDSDNGILRKTTDFTTIDSSENLYFNRSYERNNKNTAHNISTILRNVPTIFGGEGLIINVDFKNNVNFNNSDEAVLVYDKAKTTGISNLNTYLSNTSNYKTVDERPGIEFSKTIKSALANRYSKAWSFSLLPEFQAFMQKNISEKQFQDIDKSFLYFLPSANIKFNHIKNARFNKDLSINFTTRVNYPSVYQLAPLRDSSNIYYIENGNALLKPSYTKELFFRYLYNSIGKKNPQSMTLDIKAGSIEKNITDSILFDATGRNTHYYVNLSGFKYISYVGTFYKAFDIKNNQLQFTVNSSLEYSYRPGYINSVLINAKNLNSTNSINISNSFNGILDVGMGQSLSTSSSIQNDNTNSYKQLVSSFSVNLAWPRRVSFNTDIHYSRNISSFNQNFNFTIWNANISYRFFKGNNGEVKLSALDLLHQNTNVIDYRSAYSATSGTVNVLKQYFMISLAYYPRRFGNGK